MKPPPSKMPQPYSYRSYRSLPRTEEPSRPAGKRRRWLWIALCLMICGSGLGSYLASAHAAAISAQQTAARRQHDKTIAAIAPQINRLLADNPTVTFSIAIQEVDKTYPTALQQFGTTGDFDAASVGKLITAADYIHKVEQGKASLQQNIDGETAGTWLRMMIVNSDDTAWQALNDYLTHPDLARYAASIGIHDYDVTDNQLSATDIVNLLSRLWQGTLLQPSGRQLLLGYLKQANYRDYIVPAVSASDTVYHKVGIDDDEVNDVAIITHGQQTVVLSIFSDGHGTYDWADRAQLMQQITQLVLSAYFS